jgi:hypothetical protein
MAVSVRDFSRAHPSADASYTSVLGRLESSITRMEELAGQQQGGYLSKHSSTVRRQELRRRLHGGLLRHLVTIAQDAAAENRALTEMFQLPASNATHKAFQTLARKMLEQGQEQKELLAKHGLADKLLEDLSAAVNEFDASVAETIEGRQDHVLARAELDTVSDEGDAARRDVGRAQPVPVRPQSADVGGVGIGEARGDGRGGGGEAGSARRAGGGEAGGVSPAMAPDRRPAARPAGLWSVSRENSRG